MVADNGVVNGSNFRMSDESDKLNTLADKLRQIGIDIAEVRQHTVDYGVDVNSPYCELLDAESLVMSASKRLRGLVVQKEHCELSIEGPL